MEDNAINQKILAQQLRKTGCAKVHVADHGLDALEILSTTTFHKSAGVEQIPLSVILLDVEMPIMDGLTCARRIRELEQTKEIVRHVPIIGITANARVEQIASCIEAGMDEVVVSDDKSLISLWSANNVCRRNPSASWICFLACWLSSINTLQSCEKSSHQLFPTF